METIKSFLAGILNFSYMSGDNTIYYIIGAVVVAAILLYLFESIIKTALGLAACVLLFNYINSPDAATWAVGIKEWFVAMFAR